MSQVGSHPNEQHDTDTSARLNWLRAGVLGANDGIVSVASLVLGVAAAGGSRSAVLTAGIAGLVAGAMSMAAGEYVSVSSQRDVERADLERERRELAAEPAAELHELARIYRSRGLSDDLADAVARELTHANALAAHAREELGIDVEGLARPFQAAYASAVSFATGAVIPLLAIALAPGGLRVQLAIAVTLVALVVLGMVGARMGGAPKLPAAVRVTVWGVFAMGITMGIGALVGSAI